MRWSHGEDAAGAVIGSTLGDYLVIARMTELGDTATSRSGGMRREAAFIAAVYTISWGLLLSASGRYWDDWAALDLGAAASSAWSKQQGLFWLSLIHI